MSPAATFLKAGVEPWLLAAFWSFAEKSELTPSVALRLVAHHVMGRAGFVPDDYDPGSERRNDFASWARRRRPVIDQEGVRPVLIARVTPGFRAAFERYATAQGVSVPAALTAIVERVVASAKITPDDVVAPMPPETRSERITVRFSKKEMAALEVLGAEFGSVRDWLVAAARAGIAPGAPQFPRAALEALYDSNRELAALGRAVGRMAQALEGPALGGDLVGEGGATPADLEALKRAIDSHTERVMALCAASTSRWSSP